MAKYGQLDARHFKGGSRIGFDRGDSFELQDVIEKLRPKRVPANIETAAFTAQVNATHEDYALVTALNVALTAASKATIPTGEAVRLLGTLETVNIEAVAHSLKYAHGGTPDNDDTVRTYTTAGVAQSEYIKGVELLTDGSGQIKIEVDDITKLTVVFHLEGWQIIDYAAQ